MRFKALDNQSHNKCYLLGIIIIIIINNNNNNNNNNKCSLWETHR